VDANDFSSTLALSQFLNQVRNNKQRYLDYFSWKKDYIWGFGHFFTPLCDLCFRLHTDTEPSVIDDVDEWWFKNACHAPKLFR